MASYTVNFNQYATQNGLPVDFTAYDNGSLAYSIVSSSGQKLLRAAGTAATTTTNFLTLNYVDSDSNRANSEVLVKGRFNSFSNAVLFGGSVRVTNSTNEYNGAVGYSSSQAKSYLWINKTVSGTQTNLVLYYDAGNSLSSNTWYWVRFRVNGTNLYVKTWQDGTAEPTSWGGVVSDSGLSSGAGVGLNVSSGDTTSYVEIAYMSIGTNGDTAQMIAPVANFTLPTKANVNTSVTFTDTTSQYPYSWSWDFGDGNTSTSQNPTHTYAATGTYTVTLTATNAAGSNTTTNSIVINNPSSVTGLSTLPGISSIIA